MTKHQTVKNLERYVKEKISQVEHENNIKIEVRVIRDTFTFEVKQ